MHRLVVNLTHCPRFFILFLALYDIAWTNSTERIARNPKATSVNTCLEMDLTGQSVGDGLAGRLYTGKLSPLNILSFLLVVVTSLDICIGKVFHGLVETAIDNEIFSIFG